MNLADTATIGTAGVGQTSLLIAAWRAKESEEIDPLFIDPIANVFVPPAIEAWAEEVAQASVSTRHLIGYRTRYFDDYLRAEMARGVTQVVLLGAGLDTRSLRLGEAGVAFYEIDQAEVIAYKQRQLERYGYASRSEFVAANYIEDDVWALLAEHGFKAERETYFIWEGNSMYIPEAAIVALLARLKTKVSRFSISFDYLSAEMIERNTGFEGAGKLVSGFAHMGAEWVTGFADIARVARAAGLALVENKAVAGVVQPAFRVALSSELFRHYSVCTLSNHE